MKLEATAMEPVIPKGKIITCPKCKMNIMEAKRDLFADERPGNNDFIIIDGKEIADGFCNCGATYWHKGQIHTTDGWMPKGITG